MPYNASGYSTFVDNTERTVLQALKDRKPDMIRSVYSEMPWNPGQGDTVTFNAIALSGYAGRVTENERYPEVNPTEGDELSKSQIQYGDKLNITRRMAKFNRYQESKMGAEALANRVSNALDLEMTNQIFGEADQTTMTPLGSPTAVNIATADGLALASASHTVNGRPGEVFSNLLSGGGALSEDNLTKIIQQGESSTPDDHGTDLNPQFDTLVIPNDQYMIRKARQLLGSELTPEDANDAINVYNGAMKLIVLKHGTRNTLGRYSTDNRYRWMVLDSNMAAQNFQVQIAENPTTEPLFLSSENVLASILVTQFAAYAAVRWQGTAYSLSTTQPS